MATEAADQKQYLTSRAGKATAGYTTGAAKAASKTASDGKIAGDFVVRHRKGFLVILAIALVASFLLNVVSSCSMMVEGLGAGLASSSYASQDDAMLGAEETYSQMGGCLGSKSWTGFNRTMITTSTISTWMKSATTPMC